MARDHGLCMTGVAQVQPNDFPPWPLALAGMFLRMFRTVFLEQMSTIPKVGSVSL